MSYYPPNPQASQQPYPNPGFPVPPPQRMPKGPRRYSMLGAMVRAPFFNGDVYRDVARNWGGIGFWYLFLLLLVAWILVMVKFHIAVAAFARNDFPAVVKDVPSITINSMDDTSATMLLTDHKFWMKQNANDIRQYDLSKIKYFYVDKVKLTGWMNTLSQFLAIGLLPIVFIFGLIGRLIQALIYGAVNMGFSSGFRANLDYAAAMRLAVISVTPVIFLDTIFTLTGLNIPMWSLLGIGISVLYMAMAVKANGNAVPPASAQGFPVTFPPQAPQPQPFQPQ